MISKVLKLTFFLVYFPVFAFTLEAYLQAEPTPVKTYLKTIDIDNKPSNFASVDCVYVINLDKRPDRWTRMKGLLEERGIHANRVSAVNGWEISNAVKKELAGPYIERLPGGAIGCFLSHVSIYQDALKRGFDRIWVLEDDADFIEDVNQVPILLKQLSEIDPEWDIFYTDLDCRNDQGGYFTNRHVRGRPDQILMPNEYYFSRNKITDKLRRIRNRYGTCSMVISKRGLEKLYHYFTHVYLWGAIDCDIHFIPTIRQYSPTFEIVTNVRGDASSDTKLWSTLNPNQSWRK